jgi:hypothetical protein
MSLQAHQVCFLLFMVDSRVGSDWLAGSYSDLELQLFEGGWFTKDTRTFVLFLHFARAKCLIKIVFCILVLVLIGIHLEMNALCP